MSKASGPAHSGASYLEESLMIVLWVLAFLVLSGSGIVLWILRTRHVLQWLPGYLRLRVERTPRVTGPTHIMFCFVDHFEPAWKRPGLEIETARVTRWCQDYPLLAGRFRDADGCHPKHTFFFPEEEYRFEHLDRLCRLCAQGFGEIEVHLHHDGDTSEGLRHKLSQFTQLLHSTHGALTTHGGAIRWGFIHGNWCLDNSRPDGRWCGVNDELIVLKEGGCYADFTFPSAPSDTQPATVNSIYYATDDPQRPKSHDKGQPVAVGGSPAGDLMLVQGILGFDWSSRKFGILPRIENSDVRAGQPPTAARVDRWIRLAPTVQGRPEWKFVKIHTHGAAERQADVLLGPPLERMYEYLTSRYNDGSQYVLHYVSAREVYNIIKAAENGETGDPGAYRDYVLAPPPFIQARAGAST
jgi:hypothetical protein